MAEFPSGVSIVTAHDDAGQPRGMTCSALCSVSLSPPILLICLRGNSPTLAGILSTGTFAVNLLHESARPAAELFSSRADMGKRFDLVTWSNGLSGPHLTEHAH